jgi:hypothetical protein
VSFLNLFCFEISLELLETVLSSSLGDLAGAGFGISIAESRNYVSLENRACIPLVDLKRLETFEGLSSSGAGLKIPLISPAV